MQEMKKFTNTQQKDQIIYSLYPVITHSFHQYQQDSKQFHQVIEEFVKHLHTTESMPEGIIESETNNSSPDLYTVIETLTALRQEISLQGRSFHRLEKALTPLLGDPELHSEDERSNGAIVNSFNEVRTAIQTFLSETLEETYHKAKKEGEEEAIQSLLDPFLDTHDQLRRLLSTKFTLKTGMKRIWPFSLLRRKKEETKNEKTLQIIYEKMNQRLISLGIVPVAKVGSPFQSDTMKAVEVSVTDTYPENTIVDIYRQGYLFEERIIRFAEVLVASPKEL